MIVWRQIKLIVVLHLACDMAFQAIVRFSDMSLNVVTTREVLETHTALILWDGKTSLFTVGWCLVVYSQRFLMRVGCAAKLASVGDALLLRWPVGQSAVQSSFAFIKVAIGLVPCVRRLFDYCFKWSGA